MLGARRIVHHRFGDERCSTCGFTKERAASGCSSPKDSCPMKGERRETPEELQARYAHLLPFRWIDV
jgi:hypothetical protein